LLAPLSTVLVHVNRVVFQLLDLDYPLVARLVGQDIIHRHSRHLLVCRVRPVHSHLFPGRAV
jgi:hypothetical protein